MPEPVFDDQDETVTTPSGKKAVLPPPPGQSSPMYNAEPASGSGKDDSPYTSDFLKRFSPDATKDLTDQLAGIERDRGAAEQKGIKDVTGRMAHDRAQMERAFAAESADANAIPPKWDADKERQERESGPIERFASIGSIFGLIASAFTKSPMTSAFNASAAAMNSIKEHDEEGYKSAYDAWKENTALALKRFGMERDLFEDANKLIDTDLSAWKVKQLGIAAQFDNKKTIAMLDAGMDDKILEMQAAQVRAAEGLVKAREDWETYDIRRSVFSTESGEYDKDHPPAPKDASPQEQAAYYKEHPDASPQKRAAYRLDILKDIAEGGKNVQMDVLRHARMESEAKGETLSAADEAAALSRAKLGPVGGMLDDDTAKLMAEQYLAGDKTVFTNLGRGAQGAQNVIKVRNAIQQSAKDQGLTGTEIALRMAEYNGLVSGERALGTRTANVEMFAGEAYKMMDVARKASKDVPRGEWIPVNQVLQSFEKQTGDPKIVAFGAAINTLVNTYAKAIAGGGQATVSDKDHARGILEAAYSEAQFDAVLDTLGKELEAARAAPRMVKQGFRDLAADKNLGGNLGPAPNTIQYDAEGNRVNK